MLIRNTYGVVGNWSESCRCARAGPCIRGAHGLRRPFLSMQETKLSRRDPVRARADGGAINANSVRYVRIIVLPHVLVHEFMSIYYALAGWSGNRERRNERTKRKREKEKEIFSMTYVLSIEIYSKLLLLSRPLSHSEDCEYKELHNACKHLSPDRSIKFTIQFHEAYVLSIIIEQKATRLNAHGCTRMRAYRRLRPLNGTVLGDELSRYIYERRGDRGGGRGRREHCS
ncbi:hypothetical protein EVAR_95205_1 [Eumeta japonica]|uniref:Uncharacterized protein n=1 Tax=Eumeta variegata TaxID=151549 RepID=A0A4C1VG05_EUMVA|nr:hypothetical protein EVAR_95205_1 [Eumeta japonica]